LIDEAILPEPASRLQSPNPAKPGYGVRARANSNYALRSLIPINAGPVRPI
jgi:hypothetical protein